MSIPEMTDSNRGWHTRRVAVALVALLFGLLYAVVATGNASAAGPVSAPDPVVGASLATIDAAGADGQAQSSLAPSDPPAPADPAVPTGGEQQASTQQQASSAAAASQQQPQNIVISIRINSPGDNGPIAQANVTVAGAGSSNSAATSQDSGPATAGTGSDQQAQTGQTADSSATATQESPQNMVISIRINSPGNDGAITQQNIVVAISSSGNVSVTSQGQGSAADDQPAQDQTQTGSGTASPRVLSAAPQSRAAKRPAAKNSDPALASPSAAHKGSSPAGGSSSPAKSWQAAAPATSTGTRLAAVHSKRSHRPVAARAGRAVRQHVAGAPRYAADLLKKVASRPALQAGGGNDVSGAVLFTLVAALGALAIFIGSSLMRPATRLLSPRARR